MSVPVRQNCPPGSSTSSVRSSSKVQAIGDREVEVQAPGEPVATVGRAAVGEDAAVEVRSLPGAGGKLDTAGERTQTCRRPGGLPVGGLDERPHDGASKSGSSANGGSSMPITP